MKNLFVLVFGLMSLLTFTSCDDKFTYDDENQFKPYGYTAKLQDSEITDENVIISKTLEIKGVRGLVFDTIEKDDWKIITQSDFSAKGTAPLKIAETEIKIDNPDIIIDLHSNYGDIPVTFDNVKVTYMYRGQLMELRPIEGLRLLIKIEDINRKYEPIFFHYGYIRYVLCVGHIPVKIHRQTFIIMDEDNLGDVVLPDLDQMSNETGEDENSGENVADQ